MGGKSSAAKRQEVANQDMIAENLRRSYDNDRTSAENERRLMDMQYNMNLESNKQKAGFEAAQRVTEERANAIRMGGELLTNFERQEKKRLMEAKKGVGQVSDADFAISEEDRQNALNLLEKPDEYWTARRQEAYDKAAGGAGSSFGSYDKFINSGVAAKKWEATQTASYEAGAAYEGRGTTTPRERGGSRPRPSAGGTTTSAGGTTTSRPLQLLSLNPNISDDEYLGNY